MSVLKSLFVFAGRHRYLTMLSLFLSMLSGLLFVLPFVMIWAVIQVLWQHGLQQAAYDQALSYGWFALASALGGILIYVLSLFCSHLAAFRIASNMRKAALQHMAQLPLGYFMEQGSGKLRKVIDEAAASTETYLAHQLPDSVQLLTTLIVILICLFLFDWRMGVATLMGVILAMLNMLKMIGPGLADAMKAYQDALEKMSNEAVEYVRGIPVVKTFQQTVFSFERFHAAIKNYEKFALGYTRQMRLPMTCFSTIVNALFIFIVGCLFLLLTSGLDVQGLFPDFMFYLILSPLVALTTNKMMFASENTMMAKDGLTRIQEILATSPLHEPDAPASPQGFEITFDHVSFTYPNNQQEVLHDISLTIPEGMTVAFVGHSGGGKSTLVSLIPRFYDVSRGSIRIGGVDIRQMDEATRMDLMSFVFQDAHLLNKSIADNVRMGYDVSDQEILQALKDAQCEEMIDAFPEGVKTLIGAKGVYLSGGERQRICLARAFVKKAPILLLDEATAYADSDNEQAMQKALKRLAKGKTTIMIAHRLSTIVNVDRIYVLDQGRIIESGRHAELISQNGQYAAMWKSYQESIDWKVGDEHA